ncbi:hypothetical protein VNO77_38959 [Canavalia gladiata]|uniref:SHSP domain-containing protein n=1 Tax=Canavalia gladiata TaxID=3824 RepID=A0AAN9PWP7_CANGL
MSTLLNCNDFQPKLETKETPESHVLLVHLPGFARKDIGATFEYDYRRVRIFGGRPLGDNRSIRFKIVYAVPWNCDVNKLKGKFEGEIYCVIMPKFIISRELVPNQNAPKSSSQDVIPSKSTTSEKGQIMEISHEQKSIFDSQKQANEATSDSMPQKGKEGISKKLAFTIDAKNQIEEKFENGEKHIRVDKEEAKRISRNTCELGKSPQKVVMDEKSFITKSAKKDKGKGEEREMNGKLGYADEGVYEKDIIESSKRKKIKEMADSASQALTSLVKRFNEEDMQMLLYTSSTVVVLVLGVYASYKLRF